LEKVAVFITRGSEGGRQLLLIEHPYAGIQIPAGTVDPGETPEQAAVRETHEETGLSVFSTIDSLGCEEQTLPEGFRAVIETTTVYARPDPTSFDWVAFPRGMLGALESRAGRVQSHYLRGA
jgi:8-oxo-dGTP pyrophosphatase MutT (NUDIX family)